MTTTTEGRTEGRTEGLRAIESEISAMLRRIKRLIGERATAVHPELQSSSYLLLGWIAEHGPTRASCAVEEFRVDKGALSRQLQHLEELGLVVRTPDPADGRANLVEVSDDARLRMEQVDADRRKLVDESLADWSVEELASLATQLRRYNAALD